jgi:hypothetical protein
MCIESEDESMQELYAALLLNDIKGSVTDRDLANLLETAGYNVSLYDTGDFLTFLRKESGMLVKNDMISKWEEAIEDSMSKTWNDRILENYELTFHLNRDVIRISLAFLIQHTADRKVNKESLTRTLEAAGLAESWIKDRNLNHLIREYKNGEFGKYLEKLNGEVISDLSQSNIDVREIRVIDEELPRIKQQVYERTEDERTKDENTEDKNAEDSVGINTKTVRKRRSSETVSTRNEEIEDSTDYRDSSPTEAESLVSQEEMEERIQSVRSKFSKVDSLITDAEFEQAKQILDNAETQISELKEKDSHKESGTLGEELRQLEQKCDNRLSKSRVLTQLREMDPYEFEQFVGRIWEKQGWETEVKSGSGDRGVDIEAMKEDALEKRRHLIQVKRHGQDTAVGSEDIQRYASLYQRDEQVDNVFIVTSNRFTSEAKEVAKNRDVRTIDSDKLHEMLTKT